MDFATHIGHHTFHPVALKKQTDNGILPEVEIRCFFQHAAPFGRKHHLVALATRTPHGRSFRLIQHPELNHGAVGDNARITAQSINFAHNLTLGNAAHGRIARHGSEQTQVHGDEQNLIAQICGSSSGLATCMAGSHHYYIILFKNHLTRVSHETIVL
mgnify:CR=1 FL=1